MTILPHHDEIANVLYMRRTEGVDVNGLPVMIMVAALSDYRQAPKVLDGQILERFLAAMLEQRGRILNQMSAKEHRLVKTVEIRDFAFLSVTEMLTEMLPALTRIKEMVPNLQRHYPEFCHRIFVINAPRASAH